ncbi:ficolin-1-B-like, partial [Patiria miniata]|uniref:Fibrinogen C-terminal domain-containing protein n=1 Tax=Patiria miniata TaxID=46514 RepID=A0A914AC03_PATMI
PKEKKVLCQLSSVKAKLDAGFKMFALMMLFEIVCFVSGHQCNSRQHIMFGAENRAMKERAYATKTVQSPVICGRECSMDERCKSFNFNNCKNICELNLATRREHPEDFNATQGSVYFDADEDTLLYSLTDSSLNRYTSCKMLLDSGYRSSGIYTIYAKGFCNYSLRVYCDMETDGGGWIVFQRRQDGSVDFYRNWTEYQFGFGDLSGEFWLGNDNLVTLTSDDSRGTWELRVDLEDWENNTAWAKYSDFQISPGEYNLNIGQYDANSTAGDSLALGHHTYSFLDLRGRAFTTKDRDNDAADLNCAQTYTGAWWFNGCFYSHLNGQYNPDENAGFLGLQWRSWKLDYSLEACSIKMREIGP